MSSYKGLLLALSLGLLAACDSSTPEHTAEKAAAEPAAQVQAPRAPVDTAALAKRYAGRELKVVDISEVQLDGASALSVTFSVPLDPEQPFAERLHLVDKASGKVDGAWELDDNLMELRLRHLQPKRDLELTIDAGLRGVNDARLAAASVSQLRTRDLQPSVGFASQGSLLPSRLAEGLPVIALNVDAVDVDFFRVRPAELPKLLARWGRRSQMSYWDSDALLRTADLVYSGRFDLKPAPNTRENLLLPIAGIEPLKPAGVYLAVMRRAGRYSYSNPATLFTLSDIGLSAHRFGGRLDVFAQALEGGKPQAEVNLQLLDSEGAVLAEGKTDDKGHLQLPLTDKGRVLVGHQGDQISLLRLDTPALDLSEFDIAGPAQQPLQFFVFGPRDLYRPGETVLLNALLRDRDGHALAPQPVNVEVRRPDDQVSQSFVWSPDANGLYQHQLALSGDAPTGRWQLLIDLGNGHKQLYEFQVEDFLPERMALEIKGSDTPLEPSDVARFQVQGRYLYGAPAAGNRLTGQLYVRPLREAVKALPGYQFGSVTEEELSQDVELDEVKLDEAGKGALELESRWASARSPLSLTLQASLLESGGRPVTRRLEQPVWPAARLPGLRGVFTDDQVDMNGMAEVELLIADPEGNKLAAQGVKVRLVRERRDYYWSYDDDGGWNYHYNAKFLISDERLVDVAANGTTRVSFPVQWGPYRVEVEDPQTGMVSSLRFWAGYRWQDNTEGGAVRPDQVKLALDKPAYNEGDVARISVTPPAAGSGYLLVESADGPLWWQNIDVPAEGRTFEVPVGREWARHDLYVSALVVRPGERKERVTPKRAVGLLHLPLERAPRKLALTLRAAEKMRPNQPLAVHVQAKNADGTPARQAHVLVAAVDAGILSITDYATPDPFAALFGRKAYGADQLDVYGQLIEAGQGRLASLAFGGDAGLAAGGKRPPSKVRLVALQSVPVTLDEQGEGDVSLDIPDFNGELRLMAQVWTDERYGMAEGKTVVAAPLVAELAAPRFLAGGDETSVALDLTNLSGQPQALDVKLEADGLLRLAEAPAGQTTPLQLADGQRTTLRVPVRALSGFGQGSIRVTVNGLALPGEALAPLTRDWTLGIRPAWPAQTRSFRAVLKGDSWSLPAGTLAAFETIGREARLSVSARPPLNIAEHIRALRAYPYGCAEQTTSGLYASLYLDAATRQRLGLEDEPDEQRRKAIAIGIGRLLGMQRFNGSFGLWSNESDEEPWLTAYVTDFLQRAREQGFDVPAAALAKANERLLRYLQDRNQIDVNYTDNSDYSRFAVQAYAGYVLARTQQAPLGALRSLFERRAESRSGLALVQLAVALKAMGDQPRADQALEAGLAAQAVRGDGWYADYGSTLRDEALILALLEESGLAPDQVDARLFPLSDRLAGRDWLSTQERNALFLAGRHLIGKPEPDWQASLDIAGQARTLDRDHANLRLDEQALAEPLTLTSRSPAPLYQRLTLSGYPAQAPKAGGENLSIQRDYLGLDGTPVDIRDLRSGQLVLVHLSVQARERTPDALVVDLLPAGLEPENQNLAHSAASLQDASQEVRGLQESMQGAAIKHQEFRDDRYVAAVDVSGYDTTHLLYLARAVTPGTYRVPPPQVESMYRPQWQALGDAPEVMVIHDR